MKLKLLNEEARGGYAARRLERFAERCRQGGLAVTPQRLAIIRTLLASREHPRAEAVYETVRREHPHISLATVHRTLETLCEIGEARKVTPLHDSARYDGNVVPHHHLVCIKCRRIRDVEISGADGLLDGRETLGGFRVMGASVEIQGICSECSKNRRARTQPAKRTREHAEIAGKDTCMARRAL